MEWTDMRESFYAVLLLKPAIHPEKAQESSASGTSTVSAGLRPSSNAKTPLYSSVIPLGQIGSRKAREPVLRESV
jgi:hypothetical protein